MGVDRVDVVVETSPTRRGPGTMDTDGDDRPGGGGLTLDDDEEVLAGLTWRARSSAARPVEQTEPG